MNSTPDLAVVVLSWNNSEDTLDCLRSLASAEPPVHTVVVDNGSTDGSAERIEASGLFDELLRTGANLGYAGGNDVGLEHVLARSFPYIAVLNNDTVVPPDAFRTLVGHLRERPEAAVCPRISYADAPGSYWYQGGVIDRGWPRHVQPHELDGPVSDVQETQTLTGCCIVAGAQTWRRVGSFDPGFFLTFEDSDWSMRARHSGVRLLVAGDATISHKVSRSFRAGPMPLLGTYYFVRNGLWFQWRWSRRHLPRFVVTWVLRPTARRLLGRGGDASVRFRWAGLRDALRCRHGPAPAALSGTAVRLLAVRR